MNKKNVRPTHRVIIDDSDEEVPSTRLLHNIQQKLEKSAALNGGFDKLLYKIDSIEHSQNVIATKVDKIHEAIYNPDEGLFSRISTNKASQNEALMQVEKQVVELSTWREQQSKESDHVEKISEKLSEKLENLENDVNSLNRFKSLTISAAKWVAAAFGGGIITIVFKVLYDFVIIK